MEIIQTNNFEYRNQLIDLYIEAFSTGQSQQYIDTEELEQYIDLILNAGYTVLAIEKGNVTGAMLLCPLSFEKALPAAVSDNFDVDKCLYVAEMMVAEKVRGQGIGKQLMAAFFRGIDKNSYSDVFIRVWNENIPAISLYTKMGFEPVATIEQTKTKANGSGTFVMQKIYLHKKLD